MATVKDLSGNNPIVDKPIVVSESSLPTDGTPGQVLETLGGVDVQWTDVPTELPTGGTDGQVLTVVTGSATWASAFNGFTGQIAAFGRLTAPDGWLACNGSAVSRATYTDLFAAIAPAFVSASTTSSSAVITGLSGMTLALVGATIECADFAGGSATIVSVDSDTQITVDADATATSSGDAVVRVYPWGNGDGSTTFTLPDMAGRVVIGAGAGAGLTARAVGSTGGAESVILTKAQMPSHKHGLQTRTTIGDAITPRGPVVGGPTDIIDFAETSSTNPVHASGGDESHPNMQPFVGALVCIKY